MKIVITEETNKKIQKTEAFDKVNLECLKLQDDLIKMKADNDKMANEFSIANAKNKEIETQITVLEKSIENA